jgi:hypothetical protein
MRKIKLMPDYQCFPLWEASDGMLGNIDPNSLPISQTLKVDLAEWAHSFDLTLNLDDPPSSGFPDAQTEDAFIQQGNELGIRLQKELGQSFEVILSVASA